MVGEIVKPAHSLSHKRLLQRHKKNHNSKADMPIIGIKRLGCVSQVNQNHHDSGICCFYYEITYVISMTWSIVQYVYPTTVGLSRSPTSLQELSLCERMNAHLSLYPYERDVYTLLCTFPSQIHIQRGQQFCF